MTAPLSRYRQDPAGACRFSWLTAIGAAWARSLTDHSLSQAITP
ncbi:hypothetical protein ACFVH9_31235 [Streptomyces hirsutus]